MPDTPAPDALQSPPSPSAAPTGAPETARRGAAAGPRAGTGRRADDHAGRPVDSGGAGPERGRRERVPARFVLSLGVIIALGPLTIDTYLPALPTIADDLGASEAAAQGTLTAILIGLGLGQLVLGPLADARGRRPVLLSGLVVHVAGSVVCATAPVIGVLMAGRLLQGIGGAAISVSVMATVRDRYSGVAAATVLSRLMLVIGVAPLLAPAIGGVILTMTTWRGVFVLLAAAAIGLSLLGRVTVTETLAPERRGTFSPRSVGRRYGTLLRDPTFVGLVLVAGLAFATLFGYVGSASFVLQEVYGLSVLQFGIVFACNSLGLTLAAQVNPALVRRHGSRAVLRVAVTVLAAAAATLLLATSTGVGGLAGVLAPLWVILACCGMIFPNTQALALSRHGESAGTAAAMLGASQFAVGGIAAPVAGLLATGPALSMAIVMAAASAGSAGLAAVALRAGTHAD